MTGTMFRNPGWVSGQKLDESGTDVLPVGKVAFKITPW